MKLLTTMTVGFMLSLLTVTLGSCAKDEVETAGSIYGIVNDADNGEPVQDAHVSLNPGGKTTNTGSDGRYEFSDMEPGQYTIQISRTDYKTNTKRITVIAGEQASGDMTLKRGTSRIKLNTSSLNFGSQSTSKTFTVMNTGTAGSASWSVSHSVSWLSVTPTSGSTAEGKSSTVVVNIDRSKITSDVSTNLIVEADGESLPMEVTVTKTGSGGEGEGGGEGGGSCEKITSCDAKIKVEFTQCTKIGNTVEFLFKVTNTSDDVALKFDTSALKGYDDIGNAYDYTKSELYLSGQRITLGGTSSMTFPKNVALQGKVKLPSISSKATYISRYDIKINGSTPWQVSTDKIQFENVRW